MLYVNTYGRRYKKFGVVNLDTGIEEFYTLEELKKQNQVETIQGVSTSDSEIKTATKDVVNQGLQRLRFIGVALDDLEFIQMQIVAMRYYMWTLTFNFKEPVFRKLKVPKGKRQIRGS